MPSYILSPSPLSKVPLFYQFTKAKERILWTQIVIGAFPYHLQYQIIVLRGLLLVLEDLRIPHLNQTAYQRGISIYDATFAIQEKICTGW